MKSKAESENVFLKATRSNFSFQLFNQNILQAGSTESIIQDLQEVAIKNRTLIFLVLLFKTLPLSFSTSTPNHTQKPLLRHNCKFNAVLFVEIYSKLTSYILFTQESIIKINSNSLQGSLKTSCYRFTKIFKTAKKTWQITFCNCNTVDCVKSLY